VVFEEGEYCQSWSVTWIQLTKIYVIYQSSKVRHLSLPHSEWRVRGTLEENLCPLKSE